MMDRLPAEGAILREAERLFSFFQTAGGVPVRTDILQSAETLLDLYGEDIRARAYVTSDLILGEQMLRPDFTVPVVQQHMENGAEPARYTYMGNVFRKQDAGTGRLNEYIQVGYEIFDRQDPAGADAEIFSLFSGALRSLALRPIMGDIGVLTAAVRGLETSPHRRAALLRHIWRPAKFKALLDQFSGGVQPAYREAVLGRLQSEPPRALVAAAGLPIGLREPEEVVERLGLLQEDATAQPLPSEQVLALQRLLDVAAPAPEALRELREISLELASIVPALDLMETRFDALRARGVVVDHLAFEGAFGRSTMEYYDGFVFGFYTGDGQSVASGGRYDALTRVLGQGREIPAVGGVIRPGHVVDAMRIMSESAPC